jgi:peptide/nickel transport system permease protein
MTILRTVVASGEGALGFILLTCVALAALTAPLLFPGDPLAITGPSLVPPFSDAAHLLGTDRLGRDVAVELVYGARTTLLVSVASAVTALGAGTLVGTLAGFFGGIVDEVLMRIAEAFQTIPAFLLALAFISVTGPTIPTIVLAIALGAWPQPARIARAEVLSLRERDLVAAARVIGMHPVEIALREILPNALTPVISLAAVIVAAAVLIEAALSFLGLGDPNRVTWGSMIAEGRTVLRGAPFLSIVPGLALVITVLAVHLVGRGFSRVVGVRRVTA